MKPGLGESPSPSSKVTARDLGSPGRAPWTPGHPDGDKGVERPSSPPASLASAWPNDWEAVSFGEAVSVAEGQVNPTKEPYASMYHVGPECVEPGTGRLLIRRTAREVGLKSGKYLFRPGDIVYSKIRPYLRKSILVDFEGICSADMYPLTARSEFDAGYLNALILSDAFTTQAVAQQDRTGIPKLNREQLNSILVPKPPLAEQSRIAAVVWMIQTMLGTQDRIVATLKELKSATMAKLFREGLRGEPLKQTEIGEMPESWDIVALGSIARIGNGSTPKRDNPSYWTNATIPWLTSGKVHESVIERADEFVSEQARVECHLPLVRRNSLVVAITGEGKTLGNTAMVRFDTCVSQHLAYIQFETDRVVSEFVLFYLQGRYGDLRQASQAGGSTKRALTCGFLKTYLVPVPPVADQQEVANTLGTLVRILICEEARRQALGTLFSSMLRLLMVGKLRVRVERRASDAAGPLQAQVGTAAEEKVAAAVEHFVARLVRRFEPDRVTLFGLHAPGSPRAFGDVGLLVEMPFQGLARDQAARIAREIPHDFSLDLLVRRPEELRRAREIGDRYLGGILERGRVLYTRPPGGPAREPAETETEAPRRPPQVLSEERLNELVRRIVESVAPERIVLFGSAARGEMGPDSDVDLLVVKACENRRSVAQAIYRSLRGVGVPKDIVVVTPEDVERYGDTIGFIIRPALREGRVVYAR